MELSDLPVFLRHEALLLCCELDVEVVLGEVEVRGEGLGDSPEIVPLQGEGGRFVLPGHAVEGEEPGKLALALVGEGGYVRLPGLIGVDPGTSCSVTWSPLPPEWPEWLSEGPGQS